MKTSKQNRAKPIRASFLLFVLLVGAAVLPYALSISEPARFFLLGAALVGLAFWGRRHLKLEE